MKHVRYACFSWVTGVVLFVAALCVGCGNEQKSLKPTQPTLKIGISIPSATHGWTGGVVWSANQAKQKIEAENEQVKVLISTSATTAEQVDRIENLLARQVDALVVLCQEPELLFSVCQQAKKQGVFLVIVSNPLASPIQDVFVNGDNKSFGSAAAFAMGQLLKGQGEIVVMEGVPSPINSDRVNAFRETLAEHFPNITILESQASWWNTEKGLALMENFLQKYPKIDGVWAGDDDVLLGAIKAYEESKRSDVQCMVGGGGSKLIVKKILDQDPLVRGTVTYSPRMLETGVFAALEGLQNQGKVSQAEILIPSQIVTSTNAVSHYFPDSIY